jgi:trans-aconitate 2-methyltransferase
VQQRSILHVLDLGCGTGELTRSAHDQFGARQTLGIDSSPAMLERAHTHTRPGLRFEQARIETFEPTGRYDLVLSNAALHWVGSHRALLKRITGWLTPHGQLAVQVPANHDQAAHVVAREVASEEPFASLLAHSQRVSPLLEPEEYALLLNELGYAEQRVRLEVYLHRLERTSDVIEWMKGSMLTEYAERLSDEQYGHFLERYRARLFERLGRAADDPYELTYRRLFLWATR